MMSMQRDRSPKRRSSIDGDIVDFLFFLESLGNSFSNVEETGRVDNGSGTPRTTPSAGYFKDGLDADELIFGDCSFDQKSSKKDDIADNYDDDEIIFEDFDDGPQKTKPECMIKTTATIVVEKKVEDLEKPREALKTPRSVLFSAFTRKAVPFMVLPKRKSEETLNARFSRINNRKMKRHLTPNQGLLNYLRWKGEEGFSKAFGAKAGLDDKTIENKLLKRQELIESGAKRPVMTDSVLQNIYDNKEVDHELIWRHNVEQWIQLYEWKRDAGPPVSKEELDSEIEEWMSKRGTFETGEEMEQDLIDYMTKKGFVQADKDKLDAEMDEYWSKKGQTDNAETVSSSDTSALESRRKRFGDLNAKDLDAEMNEHINAKKSNSTSTVTAVASDDGQIHIEGLSINAALPNFSLPEKFKKGYVKMAPQERLRRIIVKNALPQTKDDLDNALDVFKSRQKARLEKEKGEEKRKQEEDFRRSQEEMAELAALEKFADTDFGDDDVDMEDIS